MIKALALLLALIHLASPALVLLPSHRSDLTTSSPPTSPNSSPPTPPTL